MKAGETEVGIEMDCRERIVSFKYRILKISRCAPIHCTDIHPLKVT